MYPFVINIAIEVNRAVLLVEIKPTLGLSFDKVDVGIAEPGPIKILEVFGSIFLHLNFFISFL